MPPKKKLCVIDTNQRKITSMLQQGPELTQDAPASADSESAEPENPSEMPEPPPPPPDVDMTETDVSDGSSEMSKFQLHWFQLHKWLKFDSKLNKMFCQVCIDAKLSNAMTLGTQNFKTSTLTRHIKSADHTRAIQAHKQRKEMKAAVEKALTKEEEAIIVAMKAVYFLVKEDLPLSKYPNFIEEKIF